QDKAARILSGGSVPRMSTSTLDRNRSAIKLHMITIQKAFSSRPKLEDWRNRGRHNLRTLTPFQTSRFGYRIDSSRQPHTHGNAVTCQPLPTSSEERSPKSTALMTSSGTK